MKSTRALAAATILMLLLATTAACGGGDSSTTGATTLGVKSTTITVAAAGATPAPGTDGQALSAGETLTTNGSGFGIVNYPDGSLTRLDKNAVFTLDQVGTSASQPQVKASLKQGQAWNRVQKITGTDGQYEITTPYGTVAVRGTTFNIDCTQPPGACTVTVIEGTVEVTPTAGPASTLTAPTQASVTASAVTPPAPIPPAFTASAWAATNTQLDTAAGSALASDNPDATPLASGTAAATAGSVSAAAYPSWRNPDGSFSCPLTAAEVSKAAGTPFTTTGPQGACQYSNAAATASVAFFGSEAFDATVARCTGNEPIKGIPAPRPDLGPGAFTCTRPSIGATATSWADGALADTVASSGLSEAAHNAVTTASRQP